MRLVALDTETTGLSPRNGDRMVEIGCVEISHRKINPDNTFHHYINPKRNIPEEVIRIHGITNEKVAHAPSFPDIADSFLEFIEGATLIIHNASFDLNFIMTELQLADLPNIEDIAVIDTLLFARERHPNQRNNLDALCDRYNVARGHRQLHGALLDAQLLADVYLGMTGGRQFSLGMDAPNFPAHHFVQLPETDASRAEKSETAQLVKRPAVPVSEEERNAHQSMMEHIHKESGDAIWAPHLAPETAVENV